MQILRGFSRVEVRDGQKPRIPIPTHIARNAGFVDGQLVEIKLMGAGPAQYIMVHKRRRAR